MVSNLLWKHPLWLIPFITVFKAFIKPLQAPQGKVKIKFNLIFFRRLGTGREGLTLSFLALRTAKN